MKRAGFTLIEMLVVIGLVALMAAIFFPVFSRVREKGRQAVCLSNERQLGVAILMYAHDNNDFLPPDYDCWAGRIYPHAKNVDVFHCPSDATPSRPPYFPVSYGVNADLWHVIVTAAGRRMMVPHAMVDVSGKTVLLFEVVHASANLMLPNEGFEYDLPVPSATSVSGLGGPLYNVGFWIPTGIHYDLDEDVRYATGAMSGADAYGRETIDYDGEAGRHQGGANFLYSDAHAKWLAPQQVSTGSDAASPNSEPYYGIGPITAAGSENSHFAATFSAK